jgi:hypothetical protein
MARKELTDKRVVRSETRDQRIDAVEDILQCSIYPVQLREAIW